MKYEFSVVEPIANSSIFSFPSVTVPAAASFSTTVASYGGMKFSSILDAQVVRVPFVHILSFIPTGIPARGDSSSPFARRSSIFFALSIASSAETVRYAPISGSFSAILSR